MRGSSDRPAYVRDSLGDGAESWLRLILANESVARRHHDLGDRPVNHDADAAEWIDRVEQAKMQSRSGRDPHGALPRHALRLGVIRWRVGHESSSARNRKHHVRLDRRSCRSVVAGVQVRHRSFAATVMPVRVARMAASMTACLARLNPKNGRTISLRTTRHRMSTRGCVVRDGFDLDREPAVAIDQRPPIGIARSAARDRRFHRHRSHPPPLSRTAGHHRSRE